MSNDLQPYLTAIEEELRAAVSTPSDAVAPLYDMMAYHLGWLDEQFRPIEAYHGKRLRPLLCLLACEAAGGEWRKALPAAAALELVHNFSLIHDDIEDNSPTRRGRPTVWTLWGLAHGINAGDSMLILARLAITRLSDHGMDKATGLAAMAILDQTCITLCQGQYLDIAGEGHLEVSEEGYLQMIGAKTAALIAASTQLGTLIGGATDRTEHYRQFGWQLGLAFQMVDDILGIWGDPATTGKPAASDIRSRKMTLPIIFALQTSSQSQELADLYRKQHLSDEDVSRAVAILDRAGARQYVQQRAAQYEASALAALDAASARSPAADHLRTLATSLTSRQK
jgi:geranylgeranyl diphosphate synthase type I